MEADSEVEEEVTALEPPNVGQVPMWQDQMPYPFPFMPPNPQMMMMATPAKGQQPSLFPSYQGYPMYPFPPMMPYGMPLPSHLAPQQSSEQPAYLLPDHDDRHPTDATDESSEVEIVDGTSYPVDNSDNVSLVRIPSDDDEDPLPPPPPAPPRNPRQRPSLPNSAFPNSPYPNYAYPNAPVP